MINDPQNSDVVSSSGKGIEMWIFKAATGILAQFPHV